MTWGSCGAGAARSNPEPPSVLQRVLLVPLLTPLLAVLLVAAINPRPSVAVRLLIWTSPALPLSAWLAAAAGLGAGVSSLGTALALQGAGRSISPRRQVRRPGIWDDTEPEVQRPPEERPEQEPWDRGPKDVETKPNQASWAGPSRGASEPAPTVSVPFRVIRKPRATAPAAAAPSSPAAPAVVNDDWGSAGNDDW